MKLKAIEVCRKYDMEIILVNTLMKSLNDKEVGDMIRFAAKNTDIVRGLIFQPIAFTGRATENPFRENFREWSFAEDVEKQTSGEIKATDLFPMSVMTSPIKIMRKFMQKPWPLFSCSPQCGIVNWIYVSKDGKMYPINRFVNFDRFFNQIRKTAENAESKGKFSLLSSLFMASMLSMNMLLVTQEVGMLTLTELDHANASFAVVSVAWKNPQTNLSARLHGFYGFTTTSMLTASAAASSTTLRLT